MMEFQTKLPPAPPEPTTPEYLEAFNLNARIHYCKDTVERGLAEMCILIEQMHEGKKYKVLGYQNFEDYCQQEFGFTRAQGTKYANVGKMLKDQNVKSTLHFEDLGMEKLHLLARLDEPIRTELTETVDVESATVKELKAEIEKLRSDKTQAYQMLSKVQDETTRAHVELDQLKRTCEQSMADMDKLRKENTELSSENEYLMQRCVEAEDELEEIQNRPVDHAVVEDTESLKELERVRGLMEQQAQGFSQKEIEIEERVRKEYEEKLKEVSASSDGEQVYKFLLESSRQSVARLKAFQKQHPEFHTGTDEQFLEQMTQFFFMKLEGLM